MIKAVFLVLCFSVPLVAAAPKPKPKIVSVEPSAALAGAQVTVHGSGFSQDPSSNHVVFDAASGVAEASVITASPTALTVAVPPTAITGPLYVHVGKFTSNSVNFTVLPPVPPPADCGQVISGTVSLIATATDNVGVAEVDYYMDFLLDQSALLASSVTAVGSTYPWAWTTTGVSNGCHTVYAVAYDSARNQGVASVQVQVAN